jgi:excisionase family DNA binding protein
VHTQRTDQRLNGEPGGQHTGTRTREFAAHPDEIKRRQTEWTVVAYPGRTQPRLTGCFNQGRTMSATNHHDNHDRPLRLDSPLLKPEQAAELLAVRTSWIYEAVRTNRLPCLRIGRHIRFTREMLEEWLRERAA